MWVTYKKRKLPTYPQDNNNNNKYLKMKKTLCLVTSNCESTNQDLGNIFS